MRPIASGRSGRAAAGGASGGRLTGCALARRRVAAVPRRATPGARSRRIRSTIRAPDRGRLGGLLAPAISVRPPPWIERAAASVTPFATPLTSAAAGDQQRRVVEDGVADRRRDLLDAAALVDQRVGAVLDLLAVPGAVAVGVVGGRVGAERGPPRRRSGRRRVEPISGSDSRSVGSVPRATSSPSVRPSSSASGSNGLVPVPALVLELLAVGAAVAVGVVVARVGAVQALLGVAEAVAVGVERLRVQAAVALDVVRDAVAVVVVRVVREARGASLGGAGRRPGRAEGVRARRSSWRRASAARPRRRRR